MANKVKKLKEIKEMAVLLGLLVDLTSFCHKASHVPSIGIKILVDT
jgi:hypothetical protein